VRAGTAAIVATTLFATAGGAGGAMAAEPEREAEGTAAVPRCFGAASRDPRRPCVNPALRRRVTPKPLDALLAEPAACGKFADIGLLRPCRFGVPLDDSRDEGALIGDSHAGHWRAAVDAVAEARKLRMTGFTRAGCAFTLARRMGLQGQARERCMRFNRQLIAWFGQHPEVRTVFVSGRAQEDGVEYRQQVAGRMAAVRALPRSVRRVVVLRDVPVRPLATLDCVQRAIADRRPAGAACAPPRENVLRPDPGVGAARRLGPPRVGHVDFTRFFCGRKVCPPVIGGVLVNKDVDHMTTTFAATLGPYLVRAVTRLLPADDVELHASPMVNARARVDRAAPWSSGRICSGASDAPSRSCASPAD